jgi:hypothetical protein
MIIFMLLYQSKQHFSHSLAGDSCVLEPLIY